MRSVLEAAAGRWQGLPVCVACRGNFNVEQILARCGSAASSPPSGVGAIYFNDVAAYSCPLGWYLSASPRNSEKKKRPGFE